MAFSRSPSELVSAVPGLRAECDHIEPSTFIDIFLLLDVGLDLSCEPRKGTRLLLLNSTVLPRLIFGAKKIAPKPAASHSPFDFAFSSRKK